MGNKECKVILIFLVLTLSLLFLVAEENPLYDPAFFNQYNPSYDFYNSDGSSFEEDYFGGNSIGVYDSSIESSEEVLDGTSEGDFGVEDSSEPVFNEDFFNSEETIIEKIRNKILLASSEKYKLNFWQKTAKFFKDRGNQKIMLSIILFSIFLLVIFIFYFWKKKNSEIDRIKIILKNGEVALINKDLISARRNYSEALEIYKNMGDVERKNKVYGFINTFYQKINSI